VGAETGFWPKYNESTAVKLDKMSWKQLRECYDYFATAHYSIHHNSPMERAALERLDLIKE
jgi:hypothetical protein